MKWADFDISKLSFNTSGKTIAEVLVHKDTTIGDREIKDRNWLVQKNNSGQTFCCITRKNDDKWYKLSDFIRGLLQTSTPDMRSYMIGRAKDNARENRGSF